MGQLPDMANSTISSYDICFGPRAQDCSYSNYGQKEANYYDLKSIVSRFQNFARSHPADIFIAVQG